MGNGFGFRIADRGVVEVLMLNCFMTGRRSEADCFAGNCCSIMEMTSGARAFRALQMRRKRSIESDRLPFSTSLMYARSILARSAIFSWLMPASSRHCRSTRPTTSAELSVDLWLRGTPNAIDGNLCSM